jgi:hypothetical protein
MDVYPRVPHATIVLTRRGTEVGTWALLGPPRIDLALVDEVARWQLAARRLDCSIWLRGADQDLLDLLELVGLRVEVCRESERGEEVGVEEAVKSGDAVT